MTNAHHQIGIMHQESNDWLTAIKHFEKSESFEQIAECCIQLGNYDGLINLIDKVSDHQLLLQIGMFLQSVGLCKECVRAFCKANQAQLAVDACIAMGEWKMAMDQAREHQLENVDSLLDKYVDHMLDKDKYIEVVEVYK